MGETVVVNRLRTNLTDTWCNNGNARRRQRPACVYRLEVVLRNTGVGWEMFMSVATPRAACVPGAVCRSTAPACNTRTNKQGWCALRRSVSPDTPLNRSAMDAADDVARRIQRRSSCIKFIETRDVSHSYVRRHRASLLVRRSH